MHAVAGSEKALGAVKVTNNQIQYRSQSLLNLARGCFKRLRACSHEPETVNYPGVMVAPGQALPRVHMMICCPGTTLPAPRVNFIAPGQVQRYLITTNLSEFLYFLHKFQQKMNYKHVYLFLVLSGTFYWEIYSKH